MIKSESLTNRMEGQSEVRGAEQVAEAIAQMKPRRPDTTTELATLRERIEHSRGLLAPRGACCGHCWGEGRAAALRVIDGV